MSDKYTPTTAEIRRDWIWSKVDAYSLTMPKVHEIKDGEEQFDRWLAAHDAEVKAEAWDEGRNFGPSEGHWEENSPRLGERYWVTHDSNPYRKAAPNE